MLNVTLLYVSSPWSSVRDIAVHLLHLLYKRFFMDDFVHACRPSPLSCDEAPADAGDWLMTRDALFTGPGCRTQMHLSLTLAKLHPDLTMPIFSGTNSHSLCLSVCLSVSLSVSVCFLVLGQYCFARCRLSSSVTLPAVGRVGAWAVGLPTLHGGPVRLCPVLFSFSSCGATMEAGWYATP